MTLRSAPRVIMTWRAPSTRIQVAEHFFEHARYGDALW